MAVDPSWLYVTGNNNFSMGMRLQSCMWHGGCPIFQWSRAGLGMFSGQTKAPGQSSNWPPHHHQKKCPHQMHGSGHRWYHWHSRFVNQLWSSTCRGSGPLVHIWQASWFCWIRMKGFPNIGSASPCQHLELTTQPHG